MHPRRSAWFVAIAVVGGLVGSRVVAELPDPTTGTGDLIRTLQRGLRARESMYGELTAECIVEGWVSPERRKAQSRQTGGREIGPRSVEVVEFFWAGPQLRIEAVTLVSNGMQSWGPPGIPAGYIATKPGNDALPRALHIMDGERSCCIDFAHFTARTREVGLGRSTHTATSYLLELLLLTVNGGLPSEFLADSQRAAVETIENVGDTPCYRVAYYSQPGPDGAGYMAALWIAPEKGFAPVKFEDFKIARTNDGLLANRYISTWESMEEVRPGLWLPTRTVRHSCSYHADTPGNWRETTVITARSWQVDPPRSGRFAIDSQIPLGAKVSDTRTLSKGIGTGRTHVSGHVDQLLEAFDKDEPPPALQAKYTSAFPFGAWEAGDISMWPGGGE